VRRAPHLLSTVAVALGLAAGTAGTALAGDNDLRLLNLCQPAAGSLGVPECSWVQRDATGTRVVFDPDAQSNFRSLMSELGVVIAPRLQTPADTLGYAGFQFSAELGFTQISASSRFWDGVSVVNPASPTARRPNKYLTTVGGFVRKGLLIPFPGFEFGAGAINILGSQMYAMQGYAKLALQEGFHGWALPSVAVRGSVSQLLGTEQVDLTVFGFDVLISKAFSLAGTARVEPFAGWNILLIDARSGVIDATPGCDAYQLHLAQQGAAAPSPYCPASQNGTWDDLGANFTFPDQDIITRQRWFGGLKLKLSVFFVVGQYAIALKGTSHDEKQTSGARDASALQQSFSFSGGFDF
jgi:hypothetical protein